MSGPAKIDQIAGMTTFIPKYNIRKPILGQITKIKHINYRISKDHITGTECKNRLFGAFLPDRMVPICRALPRAAARGALLVTRVQSVFEPVRHAALRERRGANDPSDDGDQYTNQC